MGSYRIQFNIHFYQRESSKKKISLSSSLLLDVNKPFRYIRCNWTNVFNIDVNLHDDIAPFQDGLAFTLFEWIDFDTSTQKKSGILQGLPQILYLALRRFALARMSSNFMGKDVLDRLTKILEDFQQYNENWFTEEEEARAMLEEIKKEKLFVNPCIHVHDIWSCNCVAITLIF